MSEQSNTAAEQTAKEYFRELSEIGLNASRQDVAFFIDGFTQGHALASSNMVELEKVEMIFNKVKVSGKPYHLMPFDEALADILKQIKNLTIKS